MYSYKIGNIDTVPETDPFTGGVSQTVLKITETGHVTVSQEFNDNATPVDEWHRRTLAVELNHCNPDDLRRHLENNHLIQRIIDGHDTMWTGNNHVGTLSDDASAAFELLSEELYGLDDHYTLWDAEEWLGNCDADELGINANTTDNKISEIADELAQTQENGEIIDGMRVIVYSSDIQNYLTVLRNELNE